MVEMTYAHGGQVDSWDCGEIEVTNEPPPKGTPEPETGITFLKESQWKLPFRTAWVEERPVASRFEVAAVVEPAGSDRLTVNAATGGRFLHDPKRVLVEGATVKLYNDRGER